ncbi:MAG: 2-methylaconitate cis-trans isomerase PrpF [Gammaproteobacteria bacterium]|nr:2-methylaconitate cis-trans isomerase PrpF [Gammaproteobacteria bacterium]
MKKLRSLSVPATYIRGGTSKGVFFALKDLPDFARTPGEARDMFFLRVVGSPDPYGKHIDGMGGATSSTSKVVIVSPSKRKNHDLDYLFGQVSIDKPEIDWSGNCGNLSAAVAGFGISRGMMEKTKIQEDGICEVRIWQENIAKTIVAKVPVFEGIPQEEGDFELDGVAFPSAEVCLDFINPGDEGGGSVFPTGSVVDNLDVPGYGAFEVTLINAGIPTVFLRAKDLGYSGTELQADINSDEKALKKFEAIRISGSIAMGLAKDEVAASGSQHTPKIAMVAPAKDYISSSGKRISGSDIDIVVRALSMGKLHHAMMGTAAVAIGAAATIPGTLVHVAMGENQNGEVLFGHPSGTLRVGSETDSTESGWVVRKVSMSRSARVIMDGRVKVPYGQFASLLDNLNR